MAEKPQRGLKLNTVHSFWSVLMVLFFGRIFKYHKKHRSLLVTSEKVGLEVSQLTICSCLVNKVRDKMTT